MGIIMHPSQYIVMANDDGETYEEPSMVKRSPTLWPNDKCFGERGCDMEGKKGGKSCLNTRLRTRKLLYNWAAPSDSQGPMYIMIKAPQVIEWAILTVHRIVGFANLAQPISHFYGQDCSRKGLKAVAAL